MDTDTNAGAAFSGTVGAVVRLRISWPQAVEAIEDMIGRLTHGQASVRDGEKLQAIGRIVVELANAPAQGREAYPAAGGSQSESGGN